MKHRYRFFCFLVLFILLISPPASAQRRFIDSLRTTLSHKLSDTTRANTYYDIANAFYKQTNYDSARYYLAYMVPSCRRASYTLGFGHYNRLNGIIYTQQGQFSEALTFLHKAIDYFAKANREKLVARTYNSLGLLYKTMGQDNQRVDALLRQGIAYIQKSISINQRYHLPDQLIDNYVNLGIIYEDMHQYDLGRDCFLKALAINDSTGAATDAYPVIYNDLGKNANVRKDYSLAISYLNKALAINQRKNRISSLVHNYRNLNTAYRGLNQSAKALEYGELARKLVEQSNATALAQSVYGQLAETYAHAKQFNNAYLYLTKQKKLEDSLMNIQKAQAVTRLQGEYDVQKANEIAAIAARLQLAKAREVARIEAEKVTEIASIQAYERRQLASIRTAAEIEKTRAVAEVETKYETQKRIRQIAELDKQNRQQTQQVQFMAGGLVLLFMLLSLLIYQYREIQGANRRLSVKNAVITHKSDQLTGQAEQLRTVMKELHHRVKNNLAIVSGLLSLQASGQEDENVVQAVRVSQQRVEAMSLIHQRLYQTDRVSVVNMCEYLTDLVISLSRAYGYRTDTFDLQLDIEQVDLDVDVAIPLGLIVNEMVTNSFKYAYSTEKRPLLRIGLHKNTSLACPGLTLEVQDNGPGLETANWQDRSNRSSFGKRLILSLTNQLQGKLDLLTQNGTLFRLSIPYPKDAMDLLNQSNN